MCVEDYPNALCHPPTPSDCQSTRPSFAWKKVNAQDDFTVSPLRPLFVLPFCVCVLLLLLFFIFTVKNEMNHKKKKEEKKLWHKFDLQNRPQTCSQCWSRSQQSLEPKPNDRAGSWTRLRFLITCTRGQRDKKVASRWLTHWDRPFNLWCPALPPPRCQPHSRPHSRPYSPLPVIYVVCTYLYICSLIYRTTNAAIYS